MPPKTEPMSSRLMGSQTSMVRPRPRTAAAARAGRRTRAMVRGETAASISMPTRLRSVRSSSYTVSRPNRMPPTTPPARAGSARYMDSMVSAAVGLYSTSPASGESTVSKMTSQVRRLWNRRPSSRQNRCRAFIGPPPGR